MLSFARTTNLFREVLKLKYLYKYLPINMFMGHVDEETTSLKTQLLVYLVEFRIFQDSPLELFVEGCIVILIDVESTILMMDG